MQLVYTSGIFSGSRYVSVGVVEHVRFRCLHELYQSFAFFLSEFALLCFVLLHHPSGVKDGCVDNLSRYPTLVLRSIIFKKYKNRFSTRLSEQILSQRIAATPSHKHTSCWA